MTKAEEIFEKHINKDQDIRLYIKGSKLAYDVCIDAINEALNMHIVTGSIGKSTKPTLIDLVRTRGNKHICVCDLCIFKDECDWNENRYDKCLEENTDDQYYL